MILRKEVENEKSLKYINTLMSSLILRGHFCTGKLKLKLKELWNCILPTIIVWSLFYSIRIIQVCMFYLLFWKTSFFCPSELFVLSTCSEFDVIFINCCNICIIIIYVVGVRYSVFLFSFITSHLNNLWEQIHLIKTWLQILKLHL